MKPLKRYQAAQRLREIFNEHDIPDNQRAWLLRRVEALHRLGKRQTQIRAILEEELRAKGLDWEKLLALLLELAKVLIPLILALI